MVTLLRNILPFHILEQMLQEGYIRKQIHPQYKDLWIFNYSEKAQFDHVWNEATKVCRGLIVDATNPADPIVVARGFNKFFNLNTENIPETLEANLPNEIPLFTEKIDGSLGILYFWDNQWWIATRGSFDSEQARWATAWFRKNIGKWIMAESDATPVFEIVYPENRIVVSYSWEGLVLLSIIDNYMGRELPRESVEWIAQDNHVPVVKKFDKSLAECVSENNENEEGYVLTYANGLKIKCKFKDYVKLHRIITGLNPRAIWEMLSHGSAEAVDTILNDPKMPVSFIEWFRNWVEQLRSKYAQIEAEAKRVFADRPPTTRKDVALYFKKTPDLCSLLFTMLDDKDCAKIIWSKIEPKGNAVFQKDGG